MEASQENLYLHADGDYFFVNCELSARPELRGKPVIVGADRGIAVAMSPEAKALGITRGMPVFRIKKFFPKVIILNHSFDLYSYISLRMQQILQSYFDKVEEYSIDEAFSLVEPHIVKYFGGEEKLLRELKEEVEKTLNITYSFGLARTKALSKLASKLQKPAGIVMLLTQKDEIEALKNTSIEDIWGIGRRTIPRLKNLGMRTAYDFATYPASKLTQYFSSGILELHAELNGENILHIESDADPRDQKSIQSTQTFRPASTLPKVIWRELVENAERACANARDLNLVSNKASFFVKTSDFKYYSDEVKLDVYAAEPGIILKAIEKKFLKILPKRTRIRSTGIILHNLTREEKIPLDLFGKQKGALKNKAVEEVADRIRAKYGAHAIRRASSLKQKSK